MAHYQYGFKLEEDAARGTPSHFFLIYFVHGSYSYYDQEKQTYKSTKIHNSEIEIVQYADNTELTFNDDRLSLKETTSKLDIFGKISVLVLNIEKSSAVWLGSKTNSPIKFIYRCSGIQK